MLDNQPPVPASPQSGGFLIPKLEPGQSPPPYPGPAPEVAPLVTPGPADTTDFGPEQMEEDEGRNNGAFTLYWLQIRRFGLCARIMMSIMT